jgi:hypothetical protein
LLAEPAATLLASHAEMPAAAPVAVNDAVTGSSLHRLLADEAHRHEPLI